MRLAGRISDWNDDKGFGFVAPHDGGVRAFVHIKEFQRGSRRPVDGDMISYVLGVDPRGRVVARQIRHAGQRIEVPRQPSRVPRAAIGLAALACIGIAGAVGLLPLALVGVYLTMSIVSYLMYRSDKSAAKSEDQRTPEAHLHLADLLGGWPAALVAQQQFRHKTVKRKFQAAFWVTVMVNLIVVAWLARSGLVPMLVAKLGG